MLPIYCHLSKNWTSLSFDHGDYGQYIQSCEKMVKPENQPVDLPSSDPQCRTGILLIHGFLGSCYIMGDLARNFHQQGYYVRTLLLPGHGTAPGDLLGVTHRDWVKATTFAVEAFKKKVDKLILVGNSIGGALSLLHGLDERYQEFIKGLILISPAFSLKHPFGFIAKVMARLGQWVPRLGWLSIHDEKDEKKYESIPFHGAHESVLLMRMLRNRVKEAQLKLPMLTVLTESDEVVCVKKVLNFFKNTKGDNNQLIYYGNGNPLQGDQRVIVRSGALLNDHIIDLSHVCMPVSPNNAHYGRDGEYDYYLHYFNRLNLVGNEVVFKGAIHRNNLQYYPLMRVQYNPDFDFMVGRMGDFVGECVGE